jgi:hypothetical protein
MLQRTPRSRGDRLIPSCDPAALAELRRILEASDRTPILRALTARPASADLAQLIAMADTHKVVRLRLLRAIRDLGV